MEKYYYSIYGLHIVSDYKLINVIEEEETEYTDVEIKAERLPDHLLKETQSEMERGSGWVYYFQKKWGFARYINHGVFEVSNGNKITYQLKSTYNEFYVSEILVCLCLNIIMMQRGSVSLHGSCVRRNGKGIIISGDSGAGKSTVTTELIETGSCFLSDDIVPISADERIVAHSSYPQRKLCADVIERKRVDRKLISVFEEENEPDKYAINQSDQFIKGSIMIDAMYILKIDNCEEIRIEEKSGSDKLKCVIDNIFGKKYYDMMGFGMEQMKQAIMIANSVRIFVITRPRHKDTVKEIVEQIDRSLAEKMPLERK